MKRLSLAAAILFGLSAAVVSCADKLAYQPTYAIPLVDGSLTVGDVIGSRPSEIGSIEDPASGKTFFQLVYPDTLDPIPFSDFGQGSVPAGVELTLDSQRVFLRMTGKAQGGTFQFTNPTVDFEFINSVGLDFELFLDNTFTRNVSTLEEVPFAINDMPWAIPAGTNSAPSDTIHIVTNENTNDALTDVFSPSPKFLFYTPRIRTASAGTDIGSGEIQVIGNVRLPLEGFATATRQDTLPYGLEDESVREAFQETLEFALVRLAFVNGLPIEVQLEGYIVDTARTDPTGGPLRLADLPLSGQDGAALTNNIIIEGAPFANDETTPTETVIDVNVNDDALKTAILDGNAILLDYTMNTSGYTNNNEVVFFSDQQLDINVGLKFKIALEQERQLLLDTLGF